MWHKRKKEGWTCQGCGKLFNTRKEVSFHKKEEKCFQIKITANPIILGNCKFCGRECRTKASLSNHQKRCYLNPNKISGARHSVSEKTKQRLREVWKENYEKYGLTFNTRLPRFNKNACDFIDNLNKEKSWNLIHALNGKEKQIGKFFVDGYDEEKNIVFEYDEEKHYLNIEQNILKEKDFKRQQKIIERLNCKFWRYNEKKKELYCVN